MDEGIDPRVMIGPGKQLQQAREALNLTPQEMAVRLHLHMNVINAIEAENYNELPPAYMRGYIRSYARIVGLEAEPLIDAYNKIARETPVIQPWAGKPSRPVRSHDKPVKAVTYLVIVILGGLLFVWWQNREGGWPELPLSSEPAPTQPILPESQPAAPALEQPPPSEISSPSDSPPPTRAWPDSRDTTTPAVAPPAQEVPPSDATMASPPAVAGPSGGLMDSKSRSLVLEPIKDSWMEITDAKGEQLYRRLVKGGQTVSLQGEPPFKVIIGNAGSVKVLYNGKPVDISSFSRGGVARFQVGDEGGLRL